FIMFSNNLCDRESDLAAGRHTLPGYLGFSISRRIWLLLPALLVTITLFFIWRGIYSLWNIGVVLILFHYLFFYKKKLKAQTDFRKENIMAITGKIGAQYHLLMMAGLLLAIFFGA
ncbi:MAG: UbiA family prenyltransferase, partial [Clostridiales bacterium]|nr:UbiA family prenyltransferase [Clostridiales bacterium]